MLRTVTGMPLPDLDVLDDIRAAVGEGLGNSARVAAVVPLQVRLDSIVALVTIADGRRVVVKLCGQQAGHPVQFERTAMLTALARSTGAPVPEVIAADDSLRRLRWRYLITEHIDGVPWREARPRLTPTQVTAAHRQLAEVVKAIQSMRFPAFGELDLTGQPPAGQGLLSALRRRAETRIADTGARTSFHRLLDREAALFAGDARATLCHDDLHHGNLLFRAVDGEWRLVGVLDWDKAWAGSAESDVARMAFWDDMTGPGFWELHRTDRSVDDSTAKRALIYQLLWCLEYDDGSARHTADTARLCHRLSVT
jgi:aminoglycoside phosphotransferase (APT) family kinase protein